MFDFLYASENNNDITICQFIEMARSVMYTVKLKCSPNILYYYQYFLLSCTWMFIKALFWNPISECPALNLSSWFALSTGLECTAYCRLETLNVQLKLGIICFSPNRTTQQQVFSLICSVSCALTSTVNRET